MYIALDLWQIYARSFNILRMSIIRASLMLLCSMFLQIMKVTEYNCITVCKCYDCLTVNN